MQFFVRIGLFTFFGGFPHESSLIIIEFRLANPLDLFNSHKGHPSVRQLLFKRKAISPMQSPVTIRRREMSKG
jgi:hypothetical protein